MNEEVKSKTVVSNRDNVSAQVTLDGDNTTTIENSRSYSPATGDNFISNDVFLLDADGAEGGQAQTVPRDSSKSINQSEDEIDLTNESVTDAKDEGDESVQIIAGPDDGTNASNNDNTSVVPPMS